MSSHSTIRFGAAICAYDDHQWLKLVLDSIYDGCDRIFALVGNQPWNGNAVDNTETLAVFETYPDPQKKIEIVHGDWANEADQRNASLALCGENGCEICFVVDADEIYDPKELEQMMEIVRATPQIDCFTLGLHTYWKSHQFRIDPPEPLQPPVFVRVGKAKFTHNRAVECELCALISQEVGVCHHMSYARTDEQIKKKISTFSHADEIVPGWYEQIWLGWNRNRSMRNLHPTHPGAYGCAVEVPLSSLPPALRDCSFEILESAEPWRPLTGTNPCLNMDGSDLHAEAAAWQRYEFFRPWYEDRKVVDVGCGEGFGTAYISTFASDVVGIDCAPDVVSHAQSRYSSTPYVMADATLCEFADANLVLAFDVIDTLPDCSLFLSSVATSKGTFIASIQKPESALQIQEAFKDRPIRWLWQESRWPYRIVEDEPEVGMTAIAVVGEEPLPLWPTVGISIPTLNAGTDLDDAVISFSRSYPGRCEFAIVANGCDEAALKSIENLRANLPDLVHVIQLPYNLGYGVGANLGLDFLQKKGGFDYIAVSNDDVIPATDCLSEMVNSMRNLDALWKKPGVVGPMSNIVNGSQQIDLGPMDSYSEMIYRAEPWHLQHHNAAFETSQIRGLFMLIHPDCLAAVGGFDPLFGIGNCEDDDHNARCHFAGFTLWIAEGAFLYHSGSQTFKSLGVDYKALVKENADLFTKKWNATGEIDHYEIAGMPEGLELFVPLDSGMNLRAESAA